ESGNDSDESATEDESGNDSDESATEDESGNDSDESATEDESETDKPDEDLINPRNLKDGIYEVNYKVDYKGKDYSQHFLPPATLKIEKNKSYLKLKHKDTELIKKITIPDGKVKIINEEEDMRVVEFNIDNDLSKPVDIGLKMFYHLMPGSKPDAQHDMKLNLDLDSIKLVKEFTQSNPIPSDNDNKPKPKPIHNKGKLIPDKAFEINYTIMHKNGKEESAANGFFEKPGVLLEKNGDLYAQLTITNSNYVKQLSTQYKNKYSDVLIVKE